MNFVSYQCKALHSELLAELSGRFSSTFGSVFESERIFSNFRSSNSTSFFRSFRKVRNFQISEISKISKHSEKPVYEITDIFPKLPNFFRTFYRTFPNFLTKKQGSIQFRSNYCTFCFNLKGHTSKKIWLIYQSFLRLSFIGLPPSWKKITILSFDLH